MRGQRSRRVNQPGRDMPGRRTRAPGAVARKRSHAGVQWLCVLAFLTGPGCGGDGPTTPQADSAAPQTGAGPYHFGVDGFTLKYLTEINELGDGASRVNVVLWGNLEPNPPVGGQHNYTNQQEAVEAAETAGPRRRGPEPTVDGRRPSSAARRHRAR